ncbi:hypothetical protein [Thermogymnomonas acidicola]|uniref:hypothetical protein n=1 Tax=Thermogymnomonas acidicola TaxID=399579 RepID=UPI00094623E4|nr:hypothetical protein [Thermogymnomonas acidicola]
MNSPLKDLAGLVRSLHYAATFAWKVGGADRDSMEAWYGEHSDLLIRKYMDRSELVDEMGGEQRATAALRFYTIEKALYEVSYEMNNRPDWVQIPPLEYIGGLIA